MPRTCAICGSGQRAAIDAEIIAGIPYREISRRAGFCGTAAVGRHRSHMGAQLAAADLATGLNTAQDIQIRLAQLQIRLERLVSKLESGVNHRVTLAGLKECREGLKTLHEILVTSTLDQRLRKLEEGVVVSEEED